MKGVLSLLLIVAVCAAVTGYSLTVDFPVEIP